MNEKPKALRLADELEAPVPDFPEPTTLEAGAAAELRRLHAANIDCVDHFNALKAERDELLEALKALMYWDNGKSEWDEARAAIAKATGETK